MEDRRVLEKNQNICNTILSDDHQAKAYFICLKLILSCKLAILNIELLRLSFSPYAMHFENFDIYLENGMIFEMHRTGIK